MSQSGEEPNEFDHDPIIDSLLEEHLRGETPPDLTQQILARLQQESEPAREALVSTRRTSHARIYKSVKSSASRGRSLVLAISAGTVAAVIGIVSWQLSTTTEAPIAQADSDVIEAAGPDHVKLDVEFVPNESAAGPEENAVVSSDVSTESGAAADVEIASSERIAPETTVVSYFPESKYSRSGSDSQDVIAALNAEFQRQWLANGIEPAKKATDAKWLALFFDRALGREPNSDELNPFVRSRDPNKRAAIVATVVDGDEFNNHWAVILQTQLQLDENEQAKEIIQNAISDNVPYNQIVEHIAASTSLQFEQVCRSVLGANTQCAQCHESYSPAENSMSKLAYGFKHAREEFAAAVAESDEASESFVNKTWAHFLGSPLTQTADASLRPALRHLTQQFISANFDTKQLVQWVALSEPFSLSEEIKAGNKSDSLINVNPLFARRYERNSLTGSIASDLAEVAASNVVLVRSGANPENAVASLQPKLDERNQPIGNVKVGWDVIQVMNSDEEYSRIMREHDAFIRQLANANLDNSGRANHVFLRVLGRTASSEELESAVRILDADASNPMVGLRDIWWAITR
ncbi:MAG: hypothetical protein KDB27_32355 [Planctomycetales bacterium]|nr:hypothetical protein [Planctomycetales bacterium]